MECNNGVLRTLPVTFAYNKTLVVASDDEVRVPGAIEYEISIVGDLDVQSNMVMYIDYARIRGRKGANVAEEDAWIEYSYGDNDRVSYDCGGTVKFEFRDEFGFVQFNEVDFMHGENFEASDWTADHWSE